MNQANTQAHLRMRHTDVPRLGWVAENVVTPLHAPQLPPIDFEHLDDLFAIHSGYCNHLKIIINTLPTKIKYKKHLCTGKMNGHTGPALTIGDGLLVKSELAAIQIVDTIQLLCIQYY